MASDSSDPAEFRNVLTGLPSRAKKVKTAAIRSRETPIGHQPGRGFMKRITRRIERFEIPVRRVEEGVGYSVQMAAKLTGLRPEMIRYYCERRVISPVAERKPGDFIFDAPALCAMQRMTALRREHRMDLATASIVVDLLEQIDELQKRVHTVA